MKKAKILALITAVLMFAVILTGCGASAEFETYVSETCIDFDKDYKELHTMYGKVTTMNDDEIVTTLKEEIIPKSEEFVKKVKETEISDEDIKKLHEIYIEIVELRHEAYENALNGVENRDYDSIDKANDCISKADKKFEEFIEERDKLADELGVVLKK